jgi:hypothetical protein
MKYSKREVPANAGNWYVQIGRLKRIYPALTSKDLNFEPSQRQDMVESLSAALGVTNDDILDVMYRIKLEA